MLGGSYASGAMSGYQELGFRADMGPMVPGGPPNGFIAPPVPFFDALGDLQRRLSHYSIARQGPLLGFGEMNPLLPTMSGYHIFSQQPPQHYDLQRVPSCLRGLEELNDPSKEGDVYAAGPNTSVRHWSLSANSDQFGCSFYGTHNPPFMRHASSTFKEAGPSIGASHRSNSLLLATGPSNRSFSLGGGTPNLAQRSSGLQHWMFHGSMYSSLAEHRDFATLVSESKPHFEAATRLAPAPAEAASATAVAVAPQRPSSMAYNAVGTTSAIVAHKTMEPVAEPHSASNAESPALDTVTMGRSTGVSLQSIQPTDNEAPVDFADGAVGEAPNVSQDDKDDTVAVDSLTQDEDAGSCTGNATGGEGSADASDDSQKRPSEVGGVEEKREEGVEAPLSAQQGAKDSRESEGYVEPVAGNVDSPVVEASSHRAAVTSTTDWAGVRVGRAEDGAAATPSPEVVSTEGGGDARAESAAPASDWQKSRVMSQVVDDDKTGAPPKTSLSTPATPTLGSDAPMERDVQVGNAAPASEPEAHADLPAKPAANASSTHSDASTATPTASKAPPVGSISESSASAARGTVPRPPSILCRSSSFTLGSLNTAGGEPSPRLSRRSSIVIVDPAIAAEAPRHEAGASTVGFDSIRTHGMDVGNGFGVVALVEYQGTVAAGFSGHWSSPIASQCAHPSAYSTSAFTSVSPTDMPSRCNSSITEYAASRQDARASPSVDSDRTVSQGASRMASYCEPPQQPQDKLPPLTGTPRTVLNEDPQVITRAPEVAKRLSATAPPTARTLSAAPRTPAAQSLTPSTSLPVVPTAVVATQPAFTGAVLPRPPPSIFNRNPSYSSIKRPTSFSSGKENSAVATSSIVSNTRSTP